MAKTVKVACWVPPSYHGKPVGFVRSDIFRILELSERNGAAKDPLPQMFLHCMRELREQLEPCDPDQVLAFSESEAE